MKLGYVVLQLVTGIGLARLLGPEGFGTYAFALAIVALLVIPAQLGFPSYLVRMVAVYRQGNELSLQRGLVTRATQVVGISSLLIAFLTFCSINIAGFTAKGLAARPLLVALALLPLLAILETISGALRGLGHVVTGQVPNELLRPLSLLILVVAAAAIGAGLTPAGALLANVTATVVALGFGWRLLRRRLPRGSSKPAFATGAWLREALAFMLLSGAQVLNCHTGVVVLGILTSQEDVGLYRVAVQVADGLGMVLIAIAATITPHLARLHARGDWAGLQKVLVNCHRAGVAVLLPAAVMLAIKGETILALVFGPAYTAAARTMAILVLGKTAYASVCFSGAALSMFGLASVATLTTAIAALANVALNLLLVPRLGLEGAAIASAVSSLTTTSVCIAWMRVRYGIGFSAFANTVRGSRRR